MAQTNQFGVPLGPQSSALPNGGGSQEHRIILPWQSAAQGSQVQDSAHVVDAQGRPVSSRPPVQLQHKYEVRTGPDGKQYSVRKRNLCGEEPDRDTEWLIEDLLPTRSCAVLGAPQKSSKTWCLLNMAVAGAVGNGALALGQWGVRNEGFKTFIVSPEGNWETGLSQRLRAMCRGVGKDPRELQESLGCWQGSFNLQSQRDFDDLRGVLWIDKIDLLILDPLASIIGAIDENNAGELSSTLDRIRSLTLEFPGLSVVLAHHLSKTYAVIDRMVDTTVAWNSLRGSSALAGWADSLIAIQRVPEGEGSSAKPDFKPKGGASPRPDIDEMEDYEDPYTQQEVPDYNTYKGAESVAKRNIIVDHREDKAIDRPHSFIIRFQGPTKSKLVVRFEAAEYKKLKRNQSP